MPLYSKDLHKYWSIRLNSPSLSDFVCAGTENGFIRTDDINRRRSRWLLKILYDYLEWWWCMRLGICECVYFCRVLGATTEFEIWVQNNCWSLLVGLFGNYFDDRCVWYHYSTFTGFAIGAIFRATLEPPPSRWQCIRSSLQINRYIPVLIFSLCRCWCWIAYAYSNRLCYVYD